MFIDELTWEETRDAMKAGKTTVIIPTGGTEKNGYHMVLGKHNYIVTLRREPDGAAAQERARGADDSVRARKAIPIDPDPGVISLPSPAYDQLLDAAARSLKAHGFKDIIFIGDSGGNQAGMRAVAERAQQGVGGQRLPRLRADRLLRRGRDDYRAWMLEAAFGYDDQTVGSHAGISDTSQLLYVRLPACGRIRSSRGAARRTPACPAIRRRRTAEIGKAGVDFKIAAGIRQYEALKKTLK